MDMAGEHEGRGGYTMNKVWKCGLGGVFKKQKICVIDL